MRETFHRLGVTLYLVAVLGAAALRHFRQARRRRQFWRKIEARWW